MQRIRTLTKDQQGVMINHCHNANDYDAKDEDNNENNDGKEEKKTKMMTMITQMSNRHLQPFCRVYSTYIHSIILSLSGQSTIVYHTVNRCIIVYVLYISYVVIILTHK